MIDASQLERLIFAEVSMKRGSIFGAVGVLCLFGASAAQANVIDLTFEGVNTGYPSGYAFINGFYDGGTSSDGNTGPNYGIGFSSNAQAICLNSLTVTCSNTSHGGLGDPASADTGLFFLSNTSTYLNDAAGFTTGFSFDYTSVTDGGSITVYDGLNGTGDVLGTLNLSTTPEACSGYSAAFCPFVDTGISFAGTAESIGFSGVANEIVFDDVTFGSTTVGGSQVPEPITLSLFGAGLAGAAAMRRRKKASKA
jgi:hypothetical protein